MYFVEIYRGDKQTMDNQNYLSINQFSETYKCLILRDRNTFSYLEKQIIHSTISISRKIVYLLGGFFFLLLFYFVNQIE